MAIPVRGHLSVGCRPADHLIRFAPTRLLLPAVMTAAMVALTVWLGFWQVRRLEWKTALLTEIDRGEANAPVLLGSEPRPFSRVQVSGEFLSPTARYGVEVRSTQAGAAMGAQLVQPMRLPDGRVVLIDRGWMPDDAAPPAPDHQTVIAYARPPEYPVRFGAADDPVARRFYALDPAAIAAALGVQAAPYTLVALAPDQPGVFPAPATALPRPVNNHLVYAVTWFAFAGCALAVFGVYSRKVLRP